MPAKQYQSKWRKLRDTVSSADSDLTASTKSWNTFATTYHPTAGTGKQAVELMPEDKYVSICFDFKNADTDTCACTVYAYREGGCAEFIFSIDTVTAGNQESDLDHTETTRYFGDTIGTITQRWQTGSSAVTEADSGGSNGVAKADFDARGYKYLLILFTTISTGDNVRAWFAGMS